MATITDPTVLCEAGLSVTYLALAFNAWQHKHRLAIAAYFTAALLVAALAFHAAGAHAPTPPPPLTETPHSIQLSKNRMESYKERF